MTVRAVCKLLSFHFTLCAVPEAPPANVTTSLTRRNEIDVSWDPPPLDDQNGLITCYNVCYNVEGAQAEQCVNASSSSTSIILTMDISPGTTYLIRVAAATAVGLGPFSGDYRQMTLPEPTSIPSSPSPTNVPVTTTTISITLPRITNLQEFRYMICFLCITEKLFIFSPLLLPFTHTHTQSLLGDCTNHQCHHRHLTATNSTVHGQLNLHYLLLQCYPRKTIYSRRN